MKKIITLLVLLGCVGLAALIGWIIRRYNAVVVHSSNNPISVVGYLSPTPTPDPLAPYSILLLGYGGGTHDGGYLTDTMMLVRISVQDKTVTLISLPRDLWVKLPLTKTGFENRKINSAYAIGRDQIHFTEKPERFTGNTGGGELAKYAVYEVTGIAPDYFAAVSFDGFVKGIDTLGGIDVLVPHTFTDTLYPIEEEKENTCGKSVEDIKEATATLSGELLEEQFPCRYELLEFNQGIEHMDGERALKFVRSRKSKEYGGDYNRSIRQQAVITGVKDKIISLQFIPKIIPFITTITNAVQTDITASIVTEKMKIHPTITSFLIRTISITDEKLIREDISEDGQYILIPTTENNDWSGVQNYIQQKLLIQ